MSTLLRKLDESMYVRRPVVVPIGSIAPVFFVIGIGLIVVEAMFFETAASAAHSPFSTRRFIGYHLFLSEIWFIFIGNLLLFLSIGNRSFRIRKSIFTDVRAVLLTLGVYTVWFVYGALAGNSWALQEFREMAFAALSLPPVLYFGSQLKSYKVVERFVIPATLLLLLVALLGAHNASLLASTFLVAYFTLKLLYGSNWAIVGLALVSLPFLFKFAKPMIVLFGFTVGLTFILAGYFNPRSLNWILSRFKLRVAAIGVALLLAMIAAIAAINFITDGLIESIFRYFFLKERISTSGTIYGDVSGGRFAIWSAAIEAWSQRPLLGHGLGAEVEAYSTGWATKAQFHNYLVQALHNTGIVGFTLIVGGWFLWLRKSLGKIKRCKSDRDRTLLGSMLIFVLGVLFFGLYGHSFTYPPSTLLFWLFVGLLSVAHPSRLPGERT